MFQECEHFATIPFQIQEDPECPWRASLGGQKPAGTHGFSKKERNPVDGLCPQCVFAAGRKELEDEEEELNKEARTKGESLDLKARRNDWLVRYMVLEDDLKKDLDPELWS
jgi:hypothetical protein